MEHLNGFPQSDIFHALSNCEKENIFWNIFYILMAFFLYALVDVAAN